jgi:hypothetical protein
MFKIFARCSGAFAPKRYQQKAPLFRGLRPVRPAQVDLFDVRSLYRHASVPRFARDPSAVIIATTRRPHLFVGLLRVFNKSSRPVTMTKEPGFPGPGPRRRRSRRLELDGDALPFRRDSSGGDLIRDRCKLSRSFLPRLALTQPFRCYAAVVASGERRIYAPQRRGSGSASEPLRCFLWLHTSPGAHSVERPTLTISDMF